MTGRKWDAQTHRWVDTKQVSAKKIARLLAENRATVDELPAIFALVQSEFEALISLSPQTLPGSPPSSGN